MLPSEDEPALCWNQPFMFLGLNWIKSWFLNGFLWKWVLLSQRFAESSCWCSSNLRDLLHLSLTTALKSMTWGATRLCWPVGWVILCSEGLAVQPSFTVMRFFTHEAASLSFFFFVLFLRLPFLFLCSLLCSASWLAVEHFGLSPCPQWVHLAKSNNGKKNESFRP